jgi:hypothetical protein
MTSPAGPPSVPMPSPQQMAIISLTEDIATWLEECARGGRLSHRLRMADQLRSGAWRSMPRRRGAPADVARGRSRPGATALQAHALRPMGNREEPQITVAEELAGGANAALLLIESTDTDHQVALR